MGVFGKLHNGKNFNKVHGVEAKPIHHRPIFWVGCVLVLIAVVIYVMSVDLSIQPVIK